ncbi:MAG: UvrD-helicase domain-containing protein [Flavobacterium sp.]|jgi:DNA helicase-2/ATP-dependent DNA helicase PcrA|uniref:UvrD-helicase domain-containing protein n=1 Tax=Flavobacterium sp. TaxID=239 RepID=UPI003BA70590
MSLQIHNNDIDKHVDNEINDCLSLNNPKSFFLFAGAGSGKTRTLVNVLKEFKKNHGKEFRLNRKKVAIITYTNAASDEIKNRLEFDSIFSVSTIHSFAWELIQPFVMDIKIWLSNELSNEILKLEDEQSRSRDLKNKTSIDRERKIESKKKRILNLDNILKFTYNPNGDNITKDSLNHSEVISLAAYFIHHKPLMQELLICKYPILLIDESQDTKKELIDAFFELQQKKKESFSLGLFGDTMQRIYLDGKEKLDEGLPSDWLKPVKKMNHRSNKRIITLINKISEDKNRQEQIPRTDKEEGFVRLFICSNRDDKSKTEESICNEMANITNDSNWINNEIEKDVMTLILEHHMAARRMGFTDFFEPLYKEEKLKTGILDGTLSGANFFTKIILPLVEAKIKKDDFTIANIVKKESLFFKKEELLKNTDQTNNIKAAKKALLNLFALWENNKDPLLIDILQNVYKSNLFPIPNSLLIIASRTLSEQKTAIDEENNIEDEEDVDKIINAWDLALSSPFSQIKKYDLYISEQSKFGTHQGVKGLEFPRVLVILDDEESRGFSFSYEKLFGSKELTKSDKDNIKEGKETGIDRTRRLFYVACSRAKESLAIVAYTDSKEIVKKNAIKYGWFKEDEILTI